LPCKYGYSLVGQVLEGPDDFRGRMVHLMHPHQDFARVDTQSVYIIPDGIPPLRAAFASNLETAITAIWDSEISVGDSILVVGFGLIGALIALVASMIPGMKVIVHEINQNRRTLASEMGFELLPDGLPEGTFDASFNTSADGSGLQLCIDNTGSENPVVDVSFYGSSEVSVKLGTNFHTGRKRIIASQVSHIPGKRMNHWDILRRRQLAFELLKNDRYDSLLGINIPFKETPGFFDVVRNGTIEAISAIINYQIKPNHNVLR